MGKMSDIRYDGVFSRVRTGGCVPRSCESIGRVVSYTRHRETHLSISVSLFRVPRGDGIVSE